MNIRFEDQKQYIEGLEKYHHIHAKDMSIHEEMAKQNSISEIFHTNEVLMLYYNEKNSDIFLKVIERIKYETDNGIKVFNLSGIDICYEHREKNGKSRSVLYIKKTDKAFFEDYFTEF